jgi:DNA modification methylase
VLSRGHYHWQHEPCWYAVREGGQGHWQGARDQTTIWAIDGAAEDQDTSHSTQKPVECMRRPIQNNSKPGDAVYEPFSGSGTTIIAAELENRRCYAVELSPEYVDVAVLRWQAFTGKQAQLNTSETFTQVAEQRGLRAGEELA